MTDTILIPGARDVRGSLDTIAGGRDDNSHGGDSRGDDGQPESIVVACPPHPQHRGHRGDERLTAVSDALVDRGVDCLRFDYGAWDGGYGECTDAEQAVAWAADRYDRVGLFGFSFGATVALVTAASAPTVAAVSALAPTARVNPDADAVEALDHVACPVQVVYGTRDTTADWEPVVDRLCEIRDDDRGRDDNRNRHVLTEIEADHFFVGRAPAVADEIAVFLVRWLRE